MAKIVAEDNRLTLVDVMQGLAMVLVIIGHHLFDFMPGEYRLCHTYIYTFHMPFFISISGFLIAYSYKNVNYGTYIAKKFHKFFLPYIIVGLVITLLAAIKLGWDTVPENLIALIIAPKQSEATFLWYIYLLFIFYMIYPVLDYVKKRKDKWLYVIYVIGIVLYLFPVESGILCLVFFIIGIITAWHFRQLKEHVTSIYYLSIVFLLFFILASIFYLKGEYSIRILLPFLSIPALYSICLLLIKMPVIRKTLVYISRNCFKIYLVHMFFIQAAASVIMYLFHVSTLSVLQSVVFVVISSTISIIGSVYTFEVLRIISSKVRLKLNK